jgi:hypothetical protein
MKAKIIFISIIVLAISLRLIFFKEITFFYDQAKDALTSMEIWQGDPLKILGPQTDFKGLHHGPMYWYLISPVYFFSKGSPFQVKLFLITLNLINIFVIYKLTQSMFKKREVSLLAAFLYAISFEAIQYARWLSNPAPALVTSTISFWSLYQLTQNKKWAIIPLLISWAISIQFQIFMIYQIIIFVIIWISLKGVALPKVSLKAFWIALSGFLFFISTYIVSEFKFNFQGIKAFLTFFETQNFFGGSFTQMFTNYLDRLANLFFLNVWGINLFLAGLMTIATLYFTYLSIKKGLFTKELIFLLIWVLSPIIVNFFAGPNANYTNLGALSAVVILTSYLLISLKDKSKLVFGVALIIIIIGNLQLVLAKNRDGEVLFTVQKQMVLSNELKTIDWIYNEAKGQPFKLNTISAPLFINSLWADLFNWYGKTKYGYMPFWWGETQVDVAGANVKFANESPTSLHFLIIEPGAGGDNDYTIAIKALEDTRSKTVKTEKIGNFFVEKREITTPRIFTSQDVFYFVKETDVGKLRNMQ